MTTAPISLFDAHFHIIDPRFPLIRNQGFLPSPYLKADYVSDMSTYALLGGAIVSGSFQGFDQMYLKAALKTLGANFVGITQLEDSASDEHILELNEAGIRGLRFNLKRGNRSSLTALESFALRVHDVAGWHVEVYVEACHLKELTPWLMKLPKVSIDHLGVTKEGFDALLTLVEKGVHVKASGFGRVNFDIGLALTQLDAANPKALMFGSDLPSTRAPRSFRHDDVTTIQTQFDADSAERIFVSNALDFYRMPALPPPM